MWQVFAISPIFLVVLSNLTTTEKFASPKWNGIARNTSRQRPCMQGNMTKTASFTTILIRTPSESSSYFEHFVKFWNVRKLFSHKIRGDTGHLDILP